MNGRLIRKTPLWIGIVGFVSSLPTLYCWLIWFGPASWIDRYPGNPSGIMTALLCCFVASAFAAFRGSRFAYAVVAMNIGTLFFIGLRLH
ncbi:MAG: hypothetical protein JWQ49_2806 [Edaphobacter sp.]|nr:hypothetical protein [Edaphobacter sp.]